MSVSKTSETKQDIVSKTRGDRADRHRRRRRCRKGNRLITELLLTVFAWSNAVQSKHTIGIAPDAAEQIVLHRLFVSLVEREVTMQCPLLS